MELKSPNGAAVFSFHNCSNRTFMELKFGKRYPTLAGRFCSNRTFMELKLARCKAAVIIWQVLIVPLWN